MILFIFCSLQISFEYVFSELRSSDFFYKNETG